jgi:hypothetical protein
MLKSINTKYETILYHIGYSIIVVYIVISGITSYDQLNC